MTGSRSDYRLELAHWTPDACATQDINVEVRNLLALTLQQLQGAGKVAVHAVITDGNTPSERLFRSLGFRKAADKS